jgi:tetratricopeptide (TPR) repeat protein
MAAKSKRQPVRKADDRPIGKAAPRSSPQGPLGLAAWARHPAVLAGVLMLLVVLAYLPALRCGFIWDDDAYVTQNPMLTAPNGWREIWFSAHTQSQYFPLVYTTFRLERDLWGLNPFGFHLVNVVLHGANAVLVWMVLWRLRAPGAWLAAAVFALHPVQVETVAWVTELKNIESLFFYLLSLLAWMKFTERSDPQRWRYYALGLTIYLLALFAKTTACTLPVAMVLVLWLQGRRFAWSRAVQILPFLFIGFAMGLVTVWWEKHLGNYSENFGLSFTIPQRVLIAGRALWFYAAKLIWPAGLTFSYPRWEIHVTDPWQYLPVAGCMAVALLLWMGREKIGRGVIAGIVFFAAALSPLLGFVIEYTFHYSFVADHYQYNASIGLIAIVAALAWHGLGKTDFWRPFQAALLLVLGVLTWHQCGPYRNLETLWRDTVAKNPGSWMAHHNLGIELFEQGRIDEALEQYQAAVALYPDGDLEQSDLGAALLEKGHYPEAIQHLEKALALNPKLQPAENNLALAYSDLGDADQAIVHFRKALALDPNALGTYLNLGSQLRLSGKLDEAVQCYREAARRFPAEVEPLRRLARVLLEQGQSVPAAEACRQALQLAPNNSELWLDLGNACFAQKDYEGAAAGFRKALQINPASAGLHYNRGVVLGLQGKPEAERQELMEAVRLQPDYPDAIRQLIMLNNRKTN